MSMDRIGQKQKAKRQTASSHGHTTVSASRFPTLVTHGTYAWANDREERFTSGLDTLMCGLQAAQRSPESSHAS